MKQVTSIKQDYDQAESELNVGRSKLKECDSQINCLAKEQQKLQQKLSDSNVERKKMENEVVPGSKLCCIFYFIIDYLNML